MFFICIHLYEANNIYGLSGGRVGNLGVSPVGSVLIVGSRSHLRQHKLILEHLLFCNAPNINTTAPLIVVMSMPTSASV